MLISSPLYMEEIKELKDRLEMTQPVSSREQIHGGQWTRVSAPQGKRRMPQAHPPSVPPVRLVL